jgi:hypothetical protein
VRGWMMAAMAAGTALLVAVAALLLLPGRRQVPAWPTALVGMLAFGLTWMDQGFRLEAAALDRAACLALAAGIAASAATWIVAGRQARAISAASEAAPAA